MDGCPAKVRPETIWYIAGAWTKLSVEQAPGKCGGRFGSVDINELVQVVRREAQVEPRASDRGVRVRRQPFQPGRGLPACEALAEQHRVIPQEPPRHKDLRRPGRPRQR